LVLANFVGDGIPLQIFRGEQGLDLIALGRQALVLGSDLDFFKFRQCPQAQVQNGFGLNVGQLEGFDERLPSARPRSGQSE
jgi:hypothetical protein